MLATKAVLVLALVLMLTGHLVIGDLATASVLLLIVLRIQKHRRYS